MVWPFVIHCNWSKEGLQAKSEVHLKTINAAVVSEQGEHDCHYLKMSLIEASCE